jgi:DNA-binding MarR family transcriptional regulator
VRSPSRPREKPPHLRPTTRASYRLPGRKVPRELEHWTGFALIAAGDGALRRYARALEPLGLTLQDFMVMSVVLKRDGICAGAVGERLGMSRQRVSQILCALDRLGLVGREVKWGDFRRKGIWLSSSGKEMWEAGREAISRADKALHLEMSDPARRQLRQLLLSLVPGDLNIWESRLT